MNRKMIGKMLGYLFWIEAAFMVPSLGIALFQFQTGPTVGFGVTMGILILVGGLLLHFCKGAKRAFYAKEGFVIVSLSWILLSFFACLPFYISGEIPSLIDAFFEAVSGLTTTGASILTEVESLASSLLFWRSFTHWIGGMGILVFLLAVVSTSGGYSMHLLRAESPGPSAQKLVPKMRQTAALLYGIYFVLTAVLIGFLLFGGMSLFDSLCTAFATAGTGGFGIKNDSLASYSPFLQNVVTIFMIVFGINFSVFFTMLFGSVRNAFKNEELKVYLGIIVVSVGLIAFNILPMLGGLRAAVHQAFFAVGSVITTTGFAISDFNLWPELSRCILVLLMFVGACAGSTGGGLKVARVLIIVKSTVREIRKMLRPRAVEVVRISGKPLDSRVMHSTNVYFACYCLILVGVWFLISLDNFSFETNLTAVIACINNIGPGLGMVGPAGNFSAFSPFSKLVLSATMLLGRLEIFPMLILLSPDVWRKRS